MAAFLPALAGLASAGSAVASMAKKNKKRATKRVSATQVVLYDPRAAAKQIRRDVKPRRRARRASAGAFTAGRLTASTPSLQMTIGGSGNTLAFCGSANRLADIDNRGSLKIRGSGLFGDANVTNAHIGNVLRSYTGGRSVLTTGDGASSPNMRQFGVGELDNRVATIASVWSHYAIRKLRLCYIPSVSQYTSGTLQTSNLAFAITDEVDAWAGSLPTQAQSQDFPVKCFGPVYSPHEMYYEHNGSRTWYCTTDAVGDLGESYQLALYAAASAVGSAAGTIGNWWAEWELDLYRPGPIVANESIRRTPVAPPEEKDFKSQPVASHAAVNSSEVKDEKTRKSNAAAPSAPPLTRVSSTDSLLLEGTTAAAPCELHFPRPVALKPTRTKG